MTSCMEHADQYPLSQGRSMHTNMRSVLCVCMRMRVHARLHVRARACMCVHLRLYLYGRGEHKHMHHCFMKLQQTFAAEEKVPTSACLGLGKSTWPCTLACGHTWWTSRNSSTLVPSDSRIATTHGADANPIAMGRRQIGGLFAPHKVPLQLCLACPELLQLFGALRQHCIHHCLYAGRI